MRRPIGSLLAASFALAILLTGSFATATPAAAGVIAPTTTCSNGVDDTPGLGLICEVTILNTITPSGGSARVTIHECHGAAGDPEAACTTVTTVLSAPVTAVTQCNDSTNGGGGTLRCSVEVVNEFVGMSATWNAATVNQCVGSGGGITVGCSPFPATTTGASVTQCNGSANGGTLVGLTCSVTGTMSAAHIVTINQCNDSTNGGGALVICSTSMVNRAAATPSQPSAQPSPGTGAPTASSAPGAPTSMSTTGTRPPRAVVADRLLTGGLMVIVLGLATVVFLRGRRIDMR
jgi:hypothetical protein